MGGWCRWRMGMGGEAGCCGGSTGCRRPRAWGGAGTAAALVYGCNTAAVMRHAVLGVPGGGPLMSQATRNTRPAVNVGSGALRPPARACPTANASIC